MIREHSKPRLMYIALRVANPEEFDVTEECYISKGCRVTGFKEKAMKDTILVERDLLGFPIVLYYEWNIQVSIE
jgi:hypothetical protein